MAMSFSHFPFDKAMALPRAVSSLFRSSLFSTQNHHLLHYSPKIFTHNFSSSGQNLQLKVANSPEPTVIEDNGNGNCNNGNDVIFSPSLVAMEYTELNLPDYSEMGHGRIRQHVNPLRSSLSVPAEVPDWNDVFRDSSLPLMVDIGCGSGRFLLWLAKKNLGSSNYLGLEIRQKLVKRANFWAKELTIFNVHFMFANATTSFQQLASSYPGPLVLVSILCPDPHFKKRHHKRRVLQKPLLDSVTDNLISGGQVFMQSDVHEVAVDMRNQFDAVSEMLHIDAIDPNAGCDHDGWLPRNPMGIRTEREIHAELEGAKIYRRLYQKRT